MSSKVIALQGDPIVDEQSKCSEALTPGHLITLSSGQWKKHPNAGKNAAPIFALDRPEGGKDIDDAYAASDYVKAGHFPKGARVNALVGSGETLVKGETYLESAGDGTLRALSTDAATDDTQRVSVVALAGSSVTTTAQTRVPVTIV